MPVDTRISVPFTPQEGLTSQILAGLQLANEQHFRNQQIALQQQAQPSQIAEREANTALTKAQTDAATFNLQARRQMFSSLTGMQLDPNGQPQQSALPGVEAGPPRGIISDTMDKLLSDPSLSNTERQALGAAGRNAIMHAYQDPATAMDTVINTYNDILKQHGDNTRAIKTDTIQDAQSNTGWSIVGRRPDGVEAYRVTAPPPVPKSLEEATSLLGSAALAYRSDPTEGNKKALDLYTTQHDAMFKDKLAEVERNARASAIGRGADVEAMYRTGRNPITGEVLNLNNAPPSALVSPTTGQVVPQDMMALYKPSQEERQTADTARQVLAIEKGLRPQIAAHPDLIGAIAGRSQELAQKAGLSSKEAAKLIDDINFLQSASTKMHTGRFSGQIMDKMANVIKPGMNADEFTGSLDSVHDVASRYANEDKLTTVYEYQQRLAHEGQTQPAAAPSTRAPAIGTVEGGYRFKGGNPADQKNWEKQ